MITSETVAGEHTIEGRRIQMQRTTWRGRDAASYDLLDAGTGESLTEESFDWYPTETQMAAVLRGEPCRADCAGPYCRFCSREVGTDGHLIGAAEPGTNPWCCDDCWDPRLA